MKRFFLITLLFITSSGFTQNYDTLKVMSYNLLNFPGVSPERIDTLKEILAHIKPDIFMVCELTSGAGADDILFNALNEDGESAYDMADYVEGPDTQNEIYFNSDKLALYEQNVVPTVLRDINEYVLYYKSDDIETTLDTTFFYIYVCHLKASAGFEAQRNEEVTALKNYLDDRPEAENIMVGGDFNFYGSGTEPAWTTLLTEGVPIKDPLIAPGNWHADDGFAWLHTQSTRTTSFDGGAFGGIDDRFDFIFIGEDLRNGGNGAEYIDDSYRAIGQDGLHYNKSLIELPVNTSEPAPIISALYHMSDHLPIFLEVEVVKEGSSVESYEKGEFEVYYDTISDRLVFKDFNFSATNPRQFLIYSVNGQLMMDTESIEHETVISTESLEKGTYILNLVDADFSFKFVKP